MMNDAFITLIQNKEYPEIKLSEVIGNDPNNVSLVVIDMVNGFTKEGPLASDRIKAIIPNCVELIDKFQKSRCQNIFYMTDEHRSNSLEFRTFPAHCITGTSQAQIVDEIRSLRDYQSHIRIMKNSINGIHSPIGEYVAKSLNTVVIVGCCTDLCVMNYAMAVKTIRDHYNADAGRIIVVENCTQTYDAPLNSPMPHDGDFMHKMALYYMYMNGITVVSKVV